MPDLAFKAIRGKLLTEDRVGLADALKPVARDCTKAPDTESWTWERLTIYHAVRKAKSLSYNPYLILIEELKRLDKVAYVRFASVYFNVEDPEAFKRLMRDMEIDKNEAK